MNSPAVPFVTETGFLRRIAGRLKFVACTECCAMMAGNWARPGASLSALQLARLYNYGQHTPNGGRLTSQIIPVVAHYYQHAPERVASFDDARAKLRAGYVLTVGGDMSKLGTHLCRWDLKFARTYHPAAHDLCIGPIAPGDTSDNPLVWWRDPLGKGSYRGEWVPWAEVLKFAFGPADVLAYPHNAW